MHSPIAVADFQPDQIKPDDLDGLLIGDAIKNRVISDPAVQAAGCHVIEYDFEGAQFSRRYNRSLWPVQLNVGDLSSKFVRGGGDPDTPVPEEVVDAAQLIIARYAKILGFLRTSRILAIDMYNNPVDRTVWLSPNLAIDIQMSHLYEIPSVARWREGYNDSENRLLRRILRLSLPESSRCDTRRGAKSLNAVCTLLERRRSSPIGSLRNRVF